jgi:hypothetical protein
MEYWEFLIQREGDRGWRPIKTGNLQLREGKYRIVANSNLVDTQIHTRVTHQNLGTTVPQRKSQARNQATNSRGLVLITPFTDLHAGLWQFVCSGGNAEQSGWHRILKLRVLPRSNAQAPNQPVTATVPIHSLSRDLSGEIATPTEPLIPIQLTDGQDNWADGLDRLLEQLEQDSLKPRQPAVVESIPNLLQLTAIDDRPLRLISLDRQAFAGIIPGHRLSINGTCNLQLFSANLVQKVQISKLSICLRHPQTSAIMVSIEQIIPSDLHIFAFSGQIQLPSETTTSLLMGEVNLYDRYNIQLGTVGFTVTIDLNPIHESELSFLELLDSQDDDEDPHVILDRLTRELQLEPVGSVPSTQSTSHPSFIPNIATIAYPSVPAAYKRESLLAQQPSITPVAPSTPTHVYSQFPSANRDLTGDLELEFDRPAISQPQPNRSGDSLEVVVD